MTSKNSSLTKLIKEQKAITWRRLPLLALSSLMYFLYFVFGTVLVIQHMRALDPASPDALPFSFRAAEAVSAYAGLRGSAWFIGMVGAVILGVQGFSFLFKTQTVDFYESRPEKRSTRFINIFVNGIFIYTLPSFLGALLSFLIAAVSGCGSPALLFELMVARVLDLLMFLAVYGMSTLASLLTGTVVTAVLMNMYFFGLETLVRFTIFGYRVAYYATADTDNELGIFVRLKTFPPLNCLKGIIESKLLVSGGFDGTTSIVTKALPFLGGNIINIILAVVSTVLAFIVYKNRRSEDAGKAVISNALSVIIKYSAGVFFALDAGLFIYWIFGRQRGSSLPAVILTIAVSVFVTSVILQSVFGMNIRDALKRAYDMPLILCISLAVLFIYRTDALGYNKWLPDEAAVESAWLLNPNYNGDYYDEDGSYLDQREYVDKNMFLTCTSDLLTLAENGQALKKDLSVEGSDPDTETGDYWSATVGWRMKNGRTITRNILIPEDVDPALMDDIVGSEEFTRGVYMLKDPDAVLSGIYKRNKNVKLVLSVSTEHGELQGDGALFEEFLKIYKKDLSEHYDFTMASNNAPSGTVSFYTEVGPYGEYNSYYNASWPIYDSYTSTIEFLKKNDLWKGGNFEPSEIRKVVATKYNYVEEDSFSDGAESWSDSTSSSDSRTYTDPKDIEKVFDATVSSTYRSAWVKNSAFASDTNTGWDIAAYPKETTPGYTDAESCCYRMLLKGKELP